jgi:hypothetical protein
LMVKDVSHGIWMNAATDGIKSPHCKRKVAMYWTHLLMICIPRSS